MALATPALAATTFLLIPSNIDLAKGEDFTLEVIVNSEDIKNYTVKVELEYPSDLLEIKSFTFGSSWMILSQPGYDLIDNENGFLIKTAGYPGGFSEPVTFGTVLFLAKKTGNGIIKVGEDSLVLDVTNKNVLGLLTEVAVTITALPEEEIPPTRPLFDILIEPVAKQFRKASLIFILVGSGIIIILIIVVVYIIYRKKKKKIV